MYQRRPRRFRRRSNGRHQSRPDGSLQLRSRPNSFSNGQARNHFRSSQSVEQLYEKYNALAKEALSSGDRTLSENYFQHADHFSRIVAIKNSEKLANQTINTSNTSNTSSSSNTPSTSDSNIEKNNNVTEETSKEIGKLTD